MYCNVSSTNEIDGYNLSIDSTTPNQVWTCNTAKPK